MKAFNIFVAGFCACGSLVAVLQDQPINVAILVAFAGLNLWLGLCRGSSK